MELDKDEASVIREYLVSYGNILQALPVDTIHEQQELYETITKLNAYLNECGAV